MKKLLAIILLLCILCLSSCIKVPYCHITDITAYGKYDNCVSESETNWLPQLNEKTMSNFKYSYNVDCYIDCAHEIYLEFTIENEEEFTKFINENRHSIVQKYEDAIVQQFMYDESYTEVVIEDVIRTTYAYNELAIGFAYIRKFLYNEEKNSIIFVNLYVVDYWKFENSMYIERFSIDTHQLPLR